MIHYSTKSQDKVQILRYVVYTHETCSTSKSIPNNRHTICGPVWISVSITPKNEDKRYSGKSDPMSSDRLHIVSRETRR